MDIGCGDCRHSLWFAKRGFKVLAIDKDGDILKEARKRVKKLEGKKFKINIRDADIRKFKFPESFYSAVLAFNSLIFLKKSEFLKVITKIKKSLKSGGIIFISLFTKKDPLYFYFKKYGKEIEANTFFKNDEYHQFMEKGELWDLFKDFKRILYREMIIEDKFPKPHKHGIAIYVGQKQKAR